MALARQHEPLREEFRTAFDRVLDASAFILGEEVEQFERNFAAHCGSHHCIGVNSGTAALAIMLEAAGVSPGDEVIVPAHTFIATALAVRQAGGVPVCADVRADTGLLNPAAVEASITRRTTALIAVHLYGQVCEMEELRAIGERHQILVLEDAAQAHGAFYRNRPAGSLGHAAAFSFYPSKNLGALGDGGAITTDDDEIAERAKKLRDLGRSEAASHDLPGYNERLDGIQAALLSAKLPYLKAWNEARRQHAGVYREQLGSVQLLEELSDTPSIFHLFPVRVDDRDGLAESLRGEGVAFGIHYRRSLPDQPALPELADAEMPVARDWARRELSLPMFPELTEHELACVITAVNRHFND